jgi:hypothetical protein
MPTDPGECDVGVVAGAWQQQAAAEHETACGRGGCGRGGMSVPVRELRVWCRWRARAHAQERGEGSWCWGEAGVV